jgi:hypothetical protein
MNMQMACQELGGVEKQLGKQLDLRSLSMAEGMTSGCRVLVIGLGEEVDSFMCRCIVARSRLAHHWEFAVSLSRLSPEASTDIWERIAVI